MRIYNQTAKNIYNFGSIDTMSVDDGEELINGVPVEEYVAQQTKAAKAQTRRALLLALQELDLED